MSRYFFTEGLHPWDKDVSQEELPDDDAAIARGKELEADYVYRILVDCECMLVWKSDYAERMGR